MGKFIKIKTIFSAIFLFCIIAVLQNYTFANDGNIANTQYKDFIPSDIPPAVVEYAHNHNKNLPEEITGLGFKYLTVWKGNLEVYAADFIYKPLPPDPKTGEKQFWKVGLPNVLIYDCRSVRKPTIKEYYDISWFLPKYLRYTQSEHICHRDLDPFKQYKTPNPYKEHRPKYVTPKYIPKTVTKYINKEYPLSWYPGTYIRYTKYLTTYDNKYEVYFVYWFNSKTQEYSRGKHILYDCKTVREYQNNKERIDLYNIMDSDKKYKSNALPNFCKAKHGFNFHAFLQRHLLRDLVCGANMNPRPLRQSVRNL